MLHVQCLQIVSMISYSTLIPLCMFQLYTLVCSCFTGLFYHSYKMHYNIFVGIY